MQITDSIADMLTVLPPLAIAQLPTCFLNAGNLTCVCQLSEADTANTVLAKISMGSSADLTSVIGS